MATIAEYSLAGLSDLDQARYLEAAELAFVEASKWNIAIQERMRKRPLRSRAAVFTTPAGISDAITSANTIGDDWSRTTPTETQATVTAAPYYKSVAIDQMSEEASIIELMDSTVAQVVQCGAATFDYHCATAAITGTNVHYVGQTAQASITATDTMTLTEASKAHALMVAANCQPFMVPGVGEVFLAMVHPHVAHDLKIESGGILTGATNVNAPEYKGNFLGVAAGFMWIESATAPLLEADAGSGAVDVYKNVFLGRDALGLVEVPVAPTKNTDDFALNGYRSMIARISYPHTNLGTVKEIGLAANLGFGVVHDTDGLYRVECASSLGANT